MYRDGNKDTPGQTAVFSTSDLKKQLFTIDHGPRVKALAFDEKGNIYAATGEAFDSDNGPDEGAAEQVGRPEQTPRTAVLTSPTCMGTQCHLGHAPFEKRVRGQFTLFLNSTPDLFSTPKSTFEKSTFEKSTLGTARTARSCSAETRTISCSRSRAHLRSPGPRG